MKAQFIIILFVLLVAPSAFSQSPSDSARSKGEPMTKHMVDEDGDGIDDRVARKSRGGQSGKDKFVDKDGDGICDGRENGLGFRGGSGSGKGGGKQWRGGRK
jgi:hypothetical protein